MEEKYSIEEAKTLRTGIIAMLVILVMVFLTISHNASIKKKNLGGAYRIYANFGRTDGLSVGNTVRMAGVNIGRVIAAKLDENFHSKLTLEIDSKYKIPDDSSASIVSFGLIGGKYIEIDVGGSEDYIAAGGEINYTQDAMVLEELLDRIISIGKSKHAKPGKEKEVSAKNADNIDLEIKNAAENAKNTAEPINHAEESAEKTEDIKEANVKAEDVEETNAETEDVKTEDIKTEDVKTEDVKETNDE